MTEYIYRVNVLLADGTSLVALDGLKLYSPQYGQMTDGDVLRQIQADPNKYNYGFDPAAGMMTLGAVSVPREQFRGIQGHLLSMSVVDLES